MRTPVLAVLLVASLFGAACAKATLIRGEPSNNPLTLVPVPSGPPVTPTSPAYVPPTRTKPVVTVPTGPPPSTLVGKDLIKGQGPVAQTGQSVTVQYVGVNYADGKQFDASWDHGQPFPFQLGGGQVIKGWDQGVVGMRVGGRRELIIPPSLGYGSQAQGPIQANETLVFVIDLLSIK